MELTKKLILSRINKKIKGNLLVPFAGSGSECIVAKKLGISFMATEINPEYVKFTKSWLRNYDKYK